MKIELKPRRWSHHHSSRLLHVSLLATFAFISVVVLVGILFTLTYTKADQSPISNSVINSATVPDITVPTPTPTPTGEPQGSPGGVVSYFVPHTPTTTPEIVTIDINPDPQFGKVKTFSFLGGEEVYFFYNNTPAFFGNTSSKNAFIYIQVQGPVSFRSSTQADSDGKWYWHSPELLPAGSYVITATAQDPFNPSKTATVTAKFAIGSIPTVPPSSKPTIGNVGRNVIDLVVKVLPKYQVIYPGQQVVTAVRITSTNKNQQKINLDYAITGGDGSTSHFKDVVILNNGAGEFTKTFNTNPLISEGVYTVTVRMHNGQELISASTLFTVKGQAVIPIAAGVILDATTLFQVLLVLFLLFALITYFEYNKVTVLSRLIHQVTEDDLKNEK